MMYVSFKKQLKNLKNINKKTPKPKISNMPTF